MKLQAVAAMTRGRVIGKDNGLPWPHIKADMQHFVKLTRGKTIVLGYNTYLSLGEGLPNRRNLVIVNPLRGQPELINAEAVLPLPDQREAEMVRRMGHWYDGPRWPVGADEEVFLIGGAATYERYLPLCEVLHLTVVHAHLEGDAFFPALGDTWQLQTSRYHLAGSDSPYALSFETWQQVKPNNHGGYTPEFLRGFHPGVDFPG